jgi:hypothetical protein
MPEKLLAGRFIFQQSLWHEAAQNLVRCWQAGALFGVVCVGTGLAF